MPSMIAHSNLDLPFSRSRMALWHLGIPIVTQEQETFLNNNFHTLLVNDERLRKKFKHCLDFSLIPEIYRKNRYYYDSYKQVQNIVYPNCIEKFKPKRYSLDCGYHIEDYEFIPSTNSKRFSSVSSLTSRSPSPIEYPALFDDQNFLKLVENLFDERISPGLMPDEKLRNQPKTFMIVCEFDTRKDESLIYAERLKRAGNYVDVKFYENGYHGIINSNQRVALNMKNDLVKFVKENL